MEAGAGVEDGGVEDMMVDFFAEFDVQVDHPVSGVESDDEAAAADFAAAPSTTSASALALSEKLNSDLPHLPAAPAAASLASAAGLKAAVASCSTGPGCVLVLKAVADPGCDWSAALDAVTELHKALTSVAGKGMLSALKGNGLAMRYLIMFHEMCSSSSSSSSGGGEAASEAALELIDLLTADPATATTSMAAVAEVEDECDVLVYFFSKDAAPLPPPPPALSENGLFAFPGNFDGLHLNRQTATLCSGTGEPIAEAPAEHLRVLQRCISQRHKADSHVIACLMWSGAVLLSQWLWCHRFLIDRADSVLELGAGQGLCGVVAACCRPKRVVMTDVSSKSLEAIRENLSLNKANVKTAAASTDFLDWNSLDDDLNEPDRHDLIIGSELIYGVERAALVLNVIDNQLSENGVAVLLCAAAQHRFGVAEFDELLMESSTFSHCKIELRATNKNLNWMWPNRDVAQAEEESADERNLEEGEIDGGKRLHDLINTFNFYVIKRVLKHE